MRHAINERHYRKLPDFAVTMSFLPTLGGYYNARSGEQRIRFTYIIGTSNQDARLPCLLGTFDT